MIKISIKGIQELAKKLDPVTRERVLIHSLNQAGEHLKGWIMRSKLSAPPGKSATMLHAITNRLRSSIAQNTLTAQREGTKLVKRIGTNVIYAPIHEFGGTIERYSRSALYVQNRHKRGAKKGLFKKGVKFGRGSTFGAYSITIPARPFMRPSIEDSGNQSEILNILSRNLQEALAA